MLSRKFVFQWDFIAILGIAALPFNFKFIDLFYYIVSCFYPMVLENAKGGKPGSCAGLCWE